MNPATVNQCYYTLEPVGQSVRPSQVIGPLVLFFCGATVMVTKQCCKCKKAKSLNQFHKNKIHVDGLQLECKDCRMNTHLKHYYNMGLDEYDIRLKQQNGVCACCGAKESKDVRSTRFAVDHDHVTKKIRGLLCGHCNKGLGYFMDDIQKLQLAIEYLQKSRLTNEEDVVQ